MEETTKKRELMLVPAKDVQLVRAQSEQYAKLWGVSARKGAPVPLPKTLTREAFLTRIRKNPSEWHAAVKADGERMFLHIGWYNRTNEVGETVPRAFSVFVDRTSCIFPIDLEIKDTRLLQGTILDGELMRAERQFQVFDCVCASGFSLKGFEYGRALRLARMAVKFLASPTKRISISMKEPLALCNDATNLKTVFETYRRLSVRGRADGLVFTRKTRELRGGPQENILKFKPDPTVDLGWDPESKRVCVGDVAAAFPKLPPRWSPVRDALSIRIKPNSLLKDIGRPCVVECKIEIRDNSVEYVVAGRGKDKFADQLAKLDKRKDEDRDEAFLIRKKRAEASKREIFVECTPIRLRKKEWPNPEAVVIETIRCKKDGFTMDDISKLLLH